MNIIINDLDQPLIIKVASLPGERLQVYFIDNEEYFKRKQYYTDEEGKPFEDNDERAIFFARGVIETIKKLNWVPDVVYLSGWMSVFIPIYLKYYYKSDSYFQDTKFVLSIYNEGDVVLGDKVSQKLAFDNIVDVKTVEHPTIQNFVAESMELVDELIKGDKKLDKTLENAYKQSEKPKSELEY